MIDAVELTNQDLEKAEQHGIISERARIMEIIANLPLTITKNYVLREIDKIFNSPNKSELISGKDSKVINTQFDKQVQTGSDTRKGYCHKHGMPRQLNDSGFCMDCGKIVTEDKILKEKK